MLTPRFFTESLFDDWFDEFPFRDMENVNRRLYGKHAGREMLTDVRDHEDHYEYFSSEPCSLDHFRFPVVSR